MNQAATYYEVLAVSRTATSEEIKAAWKTLAKLYHPDLLGNVEPSVRQFSEARFKEINEAYRVLSNPVSRKVYDQRWAKVEEPAPASAPHSSHHASHHRPVQRRPARSANTHRDKARGVLIAMGILFCWGLAYLVITAGSPRSAQRALTERVGRVFSDIADRAAKKGCLDESDCRPYKIAAFRENMESSDGHTGLFIVQSPDRQFTAYCDDQPQGDVSSRGCSKFTEALGKTVWLDDAVGQVCYKLDSEAWTDDLGQNHKGHAECLKVVSVRKVSNAPAVWYKVLSYDSRYLSKDGHTGLFLLGSNRETVSAYCDSNGSLLDDGTNPCLSLMELVGEKVSFNPAADNADFLCFDRESRWHLNEHGEYRLDNRECLKVIERKLARSTFSQPQFSSQAPKAARP
jgi:hypothetical protein